MSKRSVYFMPNNDHNYIPEINYHINQCGVPGIPLYKPQNTITSHKQ